MEQKSSKCVKKEALNALNIILVAESSYIIIVFKTFALMYCNVLMMITFYRSLDFLKMQFVQY